MSTSAYVIRDFRLPDRPRWRTPTTSRPAKATVERLHGDFFDQLDANGEGCSGASQTFAVTSCADSQVRYISAYGSGC
jgi:hypothetical protein